MSKTELGTIDTANDKLLNDSEAEEIQEYDPSYGTGVHELLGYSEQGQAIGERDRQDNEDDAVLTGGDTETNYEQADAVGDQAVGGSAPTPDQDIVDNLGAAVGLEMAEQEWLHTDEVLNLRDERRWELEPKSSEDYSTRREEEELF